jgi:phenylpropionate dioxygenase-like ring-hydroxylating dioxygenase large terminal subunit
MNHESLLETGLRNLWYPVVPSWRVRSAPVGITRLGENLVVWRDKHGGVHALEDRCPHRGARLSLGWNIGDRVACWYHGVEVDGHGVVAAVPAVTHCPLVGKNAVKAYPAREAHGAVFVYFGDALHAEPPPLGFAEQLTSPEWSSFLCTATWRCNYRYAIENVMDPMHGSYLHAESHSMAQGDKTAEFRVRTTDRGLVFEKVNQAGVNFDWVEWGESGAHWMRLSIPYQKKFGPGGPFFIVGYVTPVDAEHCQVFFWRCRKVQGWQRDVWRFLFRNRLEGLHWAVLEQDHELLENMAPGARKREFLYQHDAGMARVRRMLEMQARAQARALEGNEGPPNDARG